MEQVENVTVNIEFNMADLSATDDVTSVRASKTGKDMAEKAESSNLMVADKRVLTDRRPPRNYKRKSRPGTCNVVYKKLFNRQNEEDPHKDVGGIKTLTQRGVGEGDVNTYIRDEYVTEIEQDLKYLKKKVGIQAASIKSKDKHLKAALVERKKLKNELRTLKSKAYEKNLLKCHLEQHCTEAQAKKLLKPDIKFSRNFEDTDMLIAIALKSLPKKAYDLVREKSFFCIPGNKTLKTWLKDRPEITAMLREKQESLGKDLLVTTELADEDQDQLQQRLLGHDHGPGEQHGDDGRAEEDVINNVLLKNFCHRKPEKVEINIKTEISGSILQLKKKSYYQSIDYFDTDIGQLRDKADPRVEDLALALLREAVVELGHDDSLYPKLRLGTLLLHLGTRCPNFSELYKYFSLIERGAGKENISWKDRNLITRIEEAILERACANYFSFDPTILPGTITTDDEVILSEEGENLLLTYVDDMEQEHREEMHHIVEPEHEPAAQPADADADGGDGGVGISQFEATDSNVLERNAAEGIVQLTSNIPNVTQPSTSMVEVTNPVVQSNVFDHNIPIAPAVTQKRSTIEDQNASNFSLGSRDLTSAMSLSKVTLNLIGQNSGSIAIKGIAAESPVRKVELKRVDRNNSSNDDDNTPVNPAETDKSSRTESLVETDIVNVPGTCPLCRQGVSSHLELDNHLFEKHGHGRVCQACGISCSSLEGYLEHTQAHVYQCEVCSVHMQGAQALGRHTWLLHQPVSCDQCSQVCQSRTQLKNHSLLHHNPRTGFVKTASNKVHYRSSTHGAGDSVSKPQTITYVTVPVHNSSANEQRLNTVNEIKATNQANPVGTTQRVSLVMVKNDKDFSKSSSSSSANTSKDIVTTKPVINIREMPATCDKQVGNESGQGVFKSFIEYQCSQCTFKTQSKVSLQEHIQKLHTSKQSKVKSPITLTVVKKTTKSPHCEMCSKLFSCEATLRTHMRTVHGDEETKTKCGYCQYTTYHISNLKKHEKIHEKRGEKKPEIQD